MALIIIIFGLDFLFTKKFKFEREKNLKETSAKLIKKKIGFAEDRTRNP